MAHRSNPQAIFRIKMLVIIGFESPFASKNEDL
jgi:hypothetical protein